jgi:acetyltransferase-like isoleucine patch superfamily enzyme
MADETLRDSELEPRSMRLSWDRGSLPSRLIDRCWTLWRKVCLRWHGAQVGAGVRVAPWSNLYGAKRLNLGAGTIIREGLRLEIHRAEGCAGEVRIGARCRIGPRNHIGAAQKVELGEAVLTAEGVTILDHEHDFTDPDDHQRRDRCVVAAPVRIEDGVFLGERVVVLKGVTIGRCAVVGAHAVVTRDLPAYSMCVGAPARPIAFWDKESRTWRKA